MIRYKSLLVLGTIATLAGASRAQAQFTTFIPPQTAAQDSVRAVAMADSAKAVADTSTALAITNMKTWVDSAAGVASPPITPLADSATAATESTTFVNGARAPATASDLPLLFLLGAGAFLIGVLLLGGREPHRPRG